MTFDERVKEVAEFGLTERQAGFLVNVMLHSGVFVRRQYCAWAGLTHGEKVHQFIKLLDRRRVATSQPCGHGRGRVYHLHYKPLYEAIGERDTRLRRPAQLARAVERLMLLDGVLLDRSLTWLGSERDKVHHFTVRMSLRRELLPFARFGQADSPTVRYFAERLPIGVDSADHHHAFLFLATRSQTGRFRVFLERHAELFRLLPSWSVRVLLPRHVTDAQKPYRRAFTEHLIEPLPLETTTELRWYFHARRGVGTERDERFFDAEVGFARSRFQALFEVWQEQGDRVLDAASSPVLKDAVARGDGCLEFVVLPYPYLHLLPLVGTA
jgi:hypothetical protein